MRRTLLASLLAALSFGLASGSALAAEAATFSSEAMVDGAVKSAAETLGVVEYNGGYAPRLRIRFQAPMFLKGFSVKVPTFCSNVDVLEAGTTTEGIDDAARTIGGSATNFAVNRGAGMRVSGVWISLNGPRSAVCDVPVFNGSSPDVTPVDGLDGRFLSDDRDYEMEIIGGRISNAGINIRNSITNQLSPVLTTGRLSGTRYSNTYLQEAYADVKVEAWGGGYVNCRLPINLQLTYDPDMGGFWLQMAHAKQMGVDSLNRCVVSGSALTTRHYNRD